MTLEFSRSITKPAGRQSLDSTERGKTGGGRLAYVSLVMFSFYLRVKLEFRSTSPQSQQKTAGFEALKQKQKPFCVDDYEFVRGNDRRSNSIISTVRRN